ncbi:hypothetical protein FACS1894152_0600 [Bacilli bacterium]|nr:hypothetical protein FACS1894152_0600 [Bacilli bacterium]
MSDLDNKDKTNNEPSNDSGLKVEFKPSNDKTEPLSVKKTPEQIKAETFTAGATPTKDQIDINANLGSFGDDTETVTTVTSAVNQQNSTQTVVDSTLEKIDNEKSNIPATKDEQINFEKFDRKKNVKAKTALGMKLDIWLRNPKMLLRIWLVAIFTILIIWACTISYIVFNTHILKHPNDFQPDALYHGIGIAGNVLSYICLFLPVFPFIYMMTAAIVGVNGVLSSRPFHFFLWTILIVAFILLIGATCLSGFYIHNCYDFNPQPKS